MAGAVRLLFGKEVADRFGPDVSSGGWLLFVLHFLGHSFVRLARFCPLLFLFSEYEVAWYRNIRADRSAW